MKRTDFHQTWCGKDEKTDKYSGQTEPWGLRQGIVKHLAKHGGWEYREEMVQGLCSGEWLSESGRRAQWEASQAGGTARVKTLRAKRTRGLWGTNCKGFAVCAWCMGCEEGISVGLAHKGLAPPTLNDLQRAHKSH